MPLHIMTRTKKISRLVGLWFFVSSLLNCHIKVKGKVAPSTPGGPKMLGKLLSGRKIEGTQ